METVHGMQEYREGKPEPERAVLKERTETTPVLRCHLHRQLNEREGAAFVLDPLLTEQHRQTDHHEIDNEDVGTPC